jgi:hypothetical protein
MVSWFMVADSAATPGHVESSPVVVGTFEKKRCTGSGASMAV